MKKSTILYLSTFLVIGLIAVAPTLAAQAVQGVENDLSTEERAAPPQPSPDDVSPAALWQGTAFCTLNGPAEVQGYRVQCNNATFLDFAIADCCIPGDHWSLKAKNWDSNPNTAVTTSPGPANAFGRFGRVYNYGGTANNPGNLDAYVQCTYLHGVDVFAAGSTISLVSDGACTVTPDTVRSRIDRSP